MGRSKSGVAGLDEAGDQNSAGEDGLVVEQVEEELPSEVIEDWSDNQLNCE